MKRALLLAVSVLVVLAAAITGIGAALPRDHTASGQVALPAAPDRVFAVISDVQRYPDWRSNVSRVEVLNSVPLRRREYDGSDAITFETVESSPPGGWQVRIADPDLPFGGTWTYTIRSEAGGARLEITENGEVYNPLFRFISRFVIGHTATIEIWLDDLRRHLAK